MKFRETPVSGAFVVELEPVGDERGFFARSFCADEFRAHGLEPAVVQCNISLNSKKGTLRGLHWQQAPKQEAKVVRCIRGSLFDVVADVRTDSPTSGRWLGVELSAENRLSVFVPPGCAHGFQTLEDNTEILYLMSEFYAPEEARGLRYDAPLFGIEWPLPVAVISENDLRWPSR